MSGRRWTMVATQLQLVQLVIMDMMTIRCANYQALTIVNNIAMQRWWGGPQNPILLRTQLRLELALAV